MFDTVTGSCSHLRLWACTRSYARNMLANPQQHALKIVASDKTRFFMRFWLVLVNQGVYDCLGGVAQVQGCHRCAARARGRVSIVASYVQHCKSQ